MYRYDQPAADKEDWGWGKGFTEKTQGKTSDGAGAAVGTAAHVGAARPSDKKHIVSRTHSQHRKPMISRLDSHPQPPI